MVTMKGRERRRRKKRQPPMAALPKPVLIVMSVLAVLLCGCAPPAEDMTGIVSYQNGAAAVSLEGRLCGLPFTACLTLEIAGEDGVRSRDFVLAYTGGALDGITITRFDGAYRAGITGNATGGNDFDNIEFGGVNGAAEAWRRLCLPAEAFCLDVLSAGVRTRREDGATLTLLDITESDGGMASVTVGGDGLPCYIEYISADGRTLDATVIYLPSPEGVTHGAPEVASDRFRN